MSEFLPYIDRIRDNGVQTLGRMGVRRNGQQEFSCVSLEPSWVLNQPFVSCIEPSKYNMVKRHSSRFGWHFHITGVPGRSFILIHGLNYYRESEGCIGVGERFKYLDEDDHYDLVDSGDTLAELLDLLPDSCGIEIREHKNFQQFYQ